MANELKLNAPWIEHYKKILAMFENDPDVIVKYDNETTTVQVLVDGEKKAYALSKILAPTKTFGNVTLSINVIPSNKRPETLSELFSVAFEGNPVFKGTAIEKTLFGTQNYAIFSKDVVQYTNDDTSKFHGTHSTLYETIAEDIFIETPPDFHFSTHRYAGKCIPYQTLSKAAWESGYDEENE